VVTDLSVTAPTSPGHADRTLGGMLSFQASRYRLHLAARPPAVSIGTRPELTTVIPILTAVLLILAGCVADPTFLTAQRHWPTDWRQSVTAALHPHRAELRALLMDLHSDQRSILLIVVWVTL
jgi:hypothetical protein